MVRATSVLASITATQKGKKDDNKAHMAMACWNYCHDVCFYCATYLECANAAKGAAPREVDLADSRTYFQFINSKLLFPVKINFVIFKIIIQNYLNI